MRTLFAVPDAATMSGHAELPLGVDVELFVGVLGETASARRVRLSVAREVLAELTEQAPEDARFAKGLMRRSARRHPSVRRAA